MRGSVGLLGASGGEENQGEKRNKKTQADRPCIQESNEGGRRLRNCSAGDYFLIKTGKGTKGLRSA